MPAGLRTFLATVPLVGRIRPTEAFADWVTGAFRGRRAK